MKELKFHFRKFDKNNAMKSKVGLSNYEVRGNNWLPIIQSLIINVDFLPIIEFKKFLHGKMTHFYTTKVKIKQSLSLNLIFSMAD